jgi:O-antigen ligase
MTASRAGFITLLVSGTACLWHFGVRGRRLYLIMVSVFTVVLLLAVAGGPLIARMRAIMPNANSPAEGEAYGSFEARKYLMSKAFEGIEHYPILGIGARNFDVYSGIWHEVHNSYLQIAVEGGIPSLVLYLLFFARGFRNLRELLRRRDLDTQTTLFVGGLHSSMIGFVVGALFAPEVYQFFPYFSVAYTAALLAMVKERGPVPETSLARKDWHSRYGILLNKSRAG